MGIPHLNKFFHTHCKNCISTIHLNSLNGKVIVVDISIYLYKFNLSGSIIDGLYQFITCFKKKNITPLFVFDGKAPKIKDATIQRRRKERCLAKEKCLKLEEELQTASKFEKPIIFEELKAMRKRATGLPSNAYEIAKECITMAGLTYYQAYAEADALCVKLVQNNVAWACLSEDMDMFVYGCPRVLRNLHLFQNKATFYDFTKILNTININLNIFKIICAVSGTDYTPANINIGIFKAHQIYQSLNNTDCFLEKLNVKCHDHGVYKKKLEEISKMFDISNKSIEQLGEKILSKNKKFSISYIVYLQENNFIFTDTIKNNYKRI